MNFCQRLYPVLGTAVCFLLGCGENGKTPLSPAITPSYQVLSVEWEDLAFKEEFIAWANLQKSRIGVTLESAPKGKGDIAIGRVWNFVKEANLDQLVPIGNDLTLSRNALKFDDFLPWIRQRFLVWDRQILALPILGDGWVCVYRKDWLLQAAQKKGATSLPPIEYWEDFLKAAQMMAEPGIAHTPGKTISSLGKDSTDWEDQFLWIHSGYSSRRIAPEEKKELFGENELFGYLYDLRSGAFQPGKAATTQAAKIWLGLAKLRLEPTPGTSPMDEFLEGKAGIGIYPLSIIPRLRAAGLVEKSGIALVPGAKQYANAKGELENSSQPNRRPLVGSRLILGMVRKSCKEQEKAWAFLADLAAPMGERWALGAKTAGVTRTDQVLRMRWDRMDLDIQNTAMLRDILREEALHPKLQNPAMYPRRADGPLRAEKLQNLLSGLKDEESADQFHDRWKSSIDSLEKLPDSERRRLVRLSAGLIP